MTSAARSRPALLGLLLCVLALLAPAARATAAPTTYVLTPSAQAYLDPEWTFSAGTTSLATALDKGVAPPTAPSLTPYATAALTNGNNASAAVWFAPTPTLAAGETLTSVTAWAYLQTGSAQSVALQIWTGTPGAPVLHGWTVVPSGTPAGWYSVTTTDPLTQTELSELALNLMASASGNGTNSTAYAAQLEIATTGAPAPPPAAPSGGGSDAGSSSPTEPSEEPSAEPAPSEEPTPPAPPADVTPFELPLPPLLAPQRSYLAADGSVKVKVGCAVEGGGFCHGRVLLRLRGPLRPTKHRRARAHAARCTRVCRDLGSSNVTIAAGKTQPVKVKLSPKIRKILFQGRKRVIVTAVVRLKKPDGKLVTSSSPLTLLRP